MTALALRPMPISRCELVSRVPHGHAHGNVPRAVRELGVRLFGERQLAQILKNTDVSTFVWGGQDNMHANVTLCAARGDHVEFCTAARGYGFRSGITAGSTSLDVGANIGDTSIQILRLNPQARVVALEPVPITYLYMQWNLRVNWIPVLRPSDYPANGTVPARGGVLPIHAGVTADGRQISMSLNPRYSKNARQGTYQPGRSVNVSTLQLPKLLLDLGVKDRRLPLLKIDCEGCEFEALPQLEKVGLLALADRIVGEIHAPQGRRGRGSGHNYERLKQDFCVKVEEGPAPFEPSQPRLYPQSELSCFERGYVP
eukprot:CAMPEP_0119365366 /NCGR_PEP_ID=MMETSP1334-20130426/12307_1 /TAXON_ID=127549 /ORGANISM="Calcidiscus leptoporus, Strain RCC1130" /LENGTH=313 /DNA_ID=CAMNT_0007381335 /DNA_START=25 /DNA_END=966 /DNA_ORIENTATION=+